jgi:hypothetical protein
MVLNTPITHVKYTEVPHLQQHFHTSWDSDGSEVEVVKVHSQEVINSASDAHMDIPGT